MMLLVSLHFAKKLMAELGPGTTRTWWRILCGFIVMFIGGSASLAYFKYGKYYSREEVVIPFIFFFGAMFVILVTDLSYRTLIDLRRMYALEQETITDPLLGIFNRRYLDRRLHEEIFRAKRHDIPFSILMLDIDFFKNVNDTFGHQTGDVVLKKLAELLAGSLRQSDTLARFGGEEFMALLPHTTGRAAYMLAEKLRELVAETVLIPVQAGVTLPIMVTISIGVAALQNCEECDAYTLIEQADTALYKAKQNGRNRVERGVHV